MIRHSKLFGNVISYEEVINRLNNNLNFIKLVGQSTEYDGTVGRYEGFDKNTISMYFTRENLNSSVLRDEFIKVF